MEILAQLALILVGGAAIGFTMVVAAMASLRRMSRVSGRHPAPTRVRWLVLPSRPALLHRRLRNSTLALRTVVPAPRRRTEPTTIQEMADELEALAASTDWAILSASRTRSGRGQLSQLSIDVRRVEDMIGRLCEVAAELSDTAPGTVGWERRADRVEDALRSHEWALRELRDFGASGSSSSASEAGTNATMPGGTR